MNLNGDEKRIRQLFREMSCDDQRRAPEFADVIEAAASAREGAKHWNHSFVLASAVAALTVVALIGLSFAVRYSKSQVPAAPTNAQVSPQPTEPPTVEVSPPQIADAQRKKERRSTIKRGPRRRPSDELAIRMKSLSAWQSPTASLLKGPGAEFFRSLPRLGESLQSIKIFSPDEFN